MTTSNKRSSDSVDDRLQKLRSDVTTNSNTSVTTNKSTLKTKPKSVSTSTPSRVASTTSKPTTRSSLRNSATGADVTKNSTVTEKKKVEDSPLAGFDKAIVDTILNEVVQNTVGVTWEDVGNTPRNTPEITHSSRHGTGQTGSHGSGNSTYDPPRYILRPPSSDSRTFTIRSPWQRQNFHRKSSRFASASYLFQYFRFLFNFQMGIFYFFATLAKIA
jgi:hypothetical protein